MRFNLQTHSKRIPTAVAALIVAAPPVLAESDNLSSSDIRDAITDEMQSAKHVPADRIDITVRDGVATLKGEVSNVLARDRALRLAGMVRGVRSVVDRIDVNPEDRPDSAIRNDAIAALAADPATESWEVGVNVDDATVSLTGRVDSYAERTLAANIVKGVRGVRNVENMLRIDYADERADRQIAEDVRARLRWDARLDDKMIDVSVENDVVQLTGKVGSAYEHTLAVSDAWVMGVDRVDAEGLDVSWSDREKMTRDTSWQAMSESEIREAVKDAMLYDPRVDSFRPEVSVEDGVVTLTGNVSNMKAKRAAAEDARNTTGVVRVKNYLKVRPDSDISDSAIERNLASALDREIMVEREEVTVEVIDGTAYLYGDVDSYFERAAAEDAAARTAGVVEVENMLDVKYDVAVYETAYDWDPVLYDYDFDYAVVAQRPDREIREEINDELFWSPFVDSDDVNVNVMDGVATLTGTVDSWSEMDAATENAIEGGAVGVINNLNVD